MKIASLVVVAAALIVMDVALIVIAASLALVGAAGTADPPGYRENDSTIRTSTDSFDSGGKRVAIECFQPKTGGPHPAVLVVHGADGFKVEPIKKVYRGLAQEAARRGYSAYLVHYYDRADSKIGDVLGYAVNFAAWLETIDDALELIERQPSVDRERIGLIGLSLGSFLSLSKAAGDERIGAVVEYFGDLPLGQPPLERMPPVLILHGERDRLVSVDKAKKLELALKAKNLTYEIKLYPNQGHGFTGDEAQDAFERTFKFLDKHLLPKAE